MLQSLLQLILNADASLIEQLKELPLIGTILQNLFDSFSAGK